MSRRSKHQTEEFKGEAVALVERSGKSVPEIAEELGMGLSTVEKHLRRAYAALVALRAADGDV